MSEPTDVRKILREIYRGPGADQDGAPRPMQPSPGPLRAATRNKLRRASEIAHRDAMLRQALRYV